MSERSRRSPAQILRAIIYARVSKDDGKRGRSCQEQIKGCTDDAEYESWPIGAVLQDNDRGASRHSKREREDFDRLPKILRRGDVLIVWEPSRITRDMKVFGWFCDLLADRGVLLYYDGRLYDMTDDDDRNAVWQDILDGAKQVGKTRKRVLRALAANLDANKPHGKTAPGYEIIYERGESVGRRVVPAQQRILKLAAQRVLEERSAVSLRKLSRELAPEWVAAGGRGFAADDIKRILTSPTTFGYRVHKKQITGVSTVDPVLDPAWYQELHAILTASDRLLHHGSEPKWLLSFIARCGVCVEAGEPGIIGHDGRTVRGRRVDSYFCRDHKHLSRKMQRVDDHVEELLIQLLELPETMQKLNARDEAGKGRVDEDLALIEQLRGEIAAFVRDAAKMRLGAQHVASYVAGMEEQIAEAQARVDVLASSPDPLLRGLAGPGARKRWARRTLEEKREVIRRSLSITIVPVGRGGRYSELGVKVRPLKVLA
jgi:site-specific DNA recombinase